MDKIQCFIEELSQIESTPLLTNMYALSSPQSEVCRHNLSLYLNYLMKNNSHLILVGEAPGYNGCRLSGIPFTCEDMFTQRLISGVMGVDLGYRIYSSGKPERELSALTVWPKLSEWHEKCGNIPLLWNICPFHPHKEGNERTNRTPCSLEVRAGTEILVKLIELFDIKHIGAIGRKSEDAIRKMKYNVDYIRHPAHGGSNGFKEGIDRFMDLTNREVQ